MWLWVLLAVLVAIIVAMEFFQARALQRLGAKPPRFVSILRVVNIVMITAAVAYAAWAFLTRGR